MTFEDTVIPTEDSFIAFASKKYIVLKTFRKNGNAISTPVWFAADTALGQRLYVTTMSTSGKVKRIRNQGKVQIAPCDARGNVLGAEVAGVAHVLTPTQYPAADAALARKYGLLYYIFGLVNRLRKNERTYIEIVPA